MEILILEEIVHTIHLYSPVLFGSKTIEELEFREVNAFDMRAIKPNMSVGDILDIAHVVCGQPKKVINSLKAEDVQQVIDYMGKALAGGV